MSLMTYSKYSKNILLKEPLLLICDQDHKKYQIWFTSIVGFFFQHGIGCDVNRNMALELYLMIVNNKIENDNLIFSNKYESKLGH